MTTVTVSIITVSFAISLNILYWVLTLGILLKWEHLAKISHMKPIFIAIEVTLILFFISWITGVSWITVLSSIILLIGIIESGVQAISCQLDLAHARKQHR